MAPLRQGLLEQLSGSSQVVPVKSAVDDQRYGSGSKLDPSSSTLRIWIRISNTDADLNSKLDNLQAKSVRVTKKFLSTQLFSFFSSFYSSPRPGAYIKGTYSFYSFTV